MSFSVKLNLCVTACVPDAAAGAGSDQTERSQPNGTGSNRPKEKKENGLSCSGCQCRGEEYGTVFKKGCAFFSFSFLNCVKFV